MFEPGRSQHSDNSVISKTVWGYKPVDRNSVCLNVKAFVRAPGLKISSKSPRSPSVLLDLG